MNDDQVSVQDVQFSIGNSVEDLIKKSHNPHAKELDKQSQFNQIGKND